MILVLLLQAATPVAPSSAASPDDVVVIGERLKRWTGRVSTTFGITRCRTTVSTGDREIDEVGCTALKSCWSSARPDYHVALRAKDEAQQAVIRADLGRCLTTSRDALVQGLASRRSARKAAS